MGPVFRGKLRGRKQGAVDNSGRVKLVFPKPEMEREKEVHRELRGAAHPELGLP